MKILSSVLYEIPTFLLEGCENVLSWSYRKMSTKIIKIQKLQIVVSALDLTLTVQKMAMEIKNFSMEKDEFEDLQCDNCEYLLNPGDKIYSCTFSRNPDCEIEGDYPRYLCEKCYKDDRDPELR